MAKVYNKVGALSALKAELHQRDIHQFHSIQEIQDFERRFDAIHASVLEESKKALRREQGEIPLKIEAIEIQIESKRKALEENFNTRIDAIETRINYLEGQQNYLLLKLISPTLIKLMAIRKNRISNSRSQCILDSTKIESGKRQRLIERLDAISEDFENMAISESRNSIKKLESTKSALNAVRPHIYGAIGESKVSSTLSKLPDDYIVINDVNVRLLKPLYMKSEDDHIYSFQIDHVVVGPTGIFAIETKHWSKKTIEEADFFSPIRQIRRSGYALFRMLNYAIEDRCLSMTGSWGDRSVSVRNVLVLTAGYEKKKFQHVKVTDLNSLNGYIEWFEKEISPKEVESISSYIRDLIS